MNFTTKNRSEVSRADWDAAVLAAGHDGFYFALSGWLDGIIHINQWGFKDYSVAVYKDHQICAIVPLQFSERDNALLSTAWGWCGPVFLDKSKKLTAFVYDYIDDLASSLKVKSVRLGMQGCVGPSLNSKGINPWIPFGYTDTSSHTQIINLQNKSAEDLWMDLSQTARQTIKKAEQSCIVELVDWRDHLENYYHLHKLTYQKSKLQPHPHDYFQMISNLSKENHKLFALMNKQGGVLAYHNDLHYNKAAWYHTAVSSDEGNKLGGHYLLTWHAIQYAKSAGCQLYEVGEVVFDEKNKKATQISFFKTRFGGELHRLYRGERQYVPQPQKEALLQVIRSSRKLIGTLKRSSNV